jgi:thiol-disulfide isomerase/thioredoxin/glutaredoxin
MPVSTTQPHGKRPTRWLGVLALALLLILVLAPRGHAEGTVHLIYFYDPSCSVCEETHREVLEPLMAEYGERLVVVELAMNDISNFSLMMDLEQAFSVQVTSIPELFIGQDALIGADQIRGGLKERVEHYMAQGGVGLPPEFLARPTPTPGAPATAVATVGCNLCEEARGGYGSGASPESAPQTPSGQVSVAQGTIASPAAVIHAAYFYQPGCEECERSEHDLQYIQERYPQVQIRRLNIKEEAALNQYLCQKAGVPEDKQLTAPAIFVGEGYLLGDQVRAQGIETLLAPYVSSGAPEPWAGWEANRAAAEHRRAFPIL